MRHFLSLLCVATAALGSAALAAITPVWSAGVAVPGEKTALYLIDSDIGEDAFFLKARPAVQKARLELLQPQAGANPLDADHKPTEIFPLIITPDAPGEIRIPDIEVEYKSGRRETVKIPPLPVVSTSEIRWQDSPVPFGVLWHPADHESYVDQPVPTAVKIFLPGDCEAPIAPQLHSVGVRAGAFRPSVQGVAAMVQSNILNPTSAYAKGQTWRTVNFSGVLTPFREGNSDIGGKLIIVQRQGFFNAGRAEVEMPVMQLGALPLPPGAPSNFAHAVGHFTLDAATHATELAMNEAVEVELTVRGNGDWEQLSCPAPADAQAWKLVPATRKPLLGPNGETVGMVFSQLLRPTAEVGGLPAFSFGYFDPQAMEYKQASTAPIALKWRRSDTAGSGVQNLAAAEPPPAGEVPVAELTDIYGFMTAEQYGRPMQLPQGLLYLLYLPAAGVLLAVLIGTLRRRYAAGASARAQERELAQMEAETDALAFLKSIGGYIESHIDTQSMTPELQAILDRRDDEAFRPDAVSVLSPAEKESMLKALRKVLSRGSALLVLALLCLQSISAAESPAEKDYNAGQYSRALQWLEQSPVPAGEEALALYNQGNCAYRLGQPGKAALRYAQALLADPGFAEARANLAFIQRKEGAILPRPLFEDELFIWLTPSQLTVAGICSTALLALCLALLLAYRGQRHPKLNALTLLSLLPVLLCAADALYYATRQVPNPAATPPSDTAMVLNASTLRATADTRGAQVITLTPSTPLHLLARRGDWCYAETFDNGTRGWVPTADISMLREGGEPHPARVLRF